GAFAGERFLGFLEQRGPAAGRGFTDLRIPFRAVATDITTGARVEIGDGTLADAMRASFAAPGLLAPYPLCGRLLVDGGICDPVPAETVRSMGADVVIGVHVVPPLDTATGAPGDAAARVGDWLNPLTYVGTRSANPGPLNVAVKSLLIMQHELGNARAGEADVLVAPSLGRYAPCDFRNAEALVSGGVVAGEAALPAIHAA